jgi:uncharacterized protein (UPF0332 family)
MSVPEPGSKHEVALYIKRAHEMLEVAVHNLAHGFYGSAINRAYYAIFYSANALLATQGITRSKHSGVIAAFRRYFVKPGLIEGKYSRIYGRVMDNRHVSDYEIQLPIDAQGAEDDLHDARRFVERIEQLLQHEGWL